MHARALCSFTVPQPGQVQLVGLGSLRSVTHSLWSRSAIAGMPRHPSPPAGRASGPTTRTGPPHVQPEAQYPPGAGPRSGRRGRRFTSGHPDRGQGLTRGNAGQGPPGSDDLGDLLRYVVRLTEPRRHDGPLPPGWWVDHDPDPVLPSPGGHANAGTAHGAAGLLAWSRMPYGAVATSPDTARPSPTLCARGSATDGRTRHTVRGGRNGSPGSACAPAAPCSTSSAPANRTPDGTHALLII
jgi:hypothetical protein